MKRIIFQFDAHCSFVMQFIRPNCTFHSFGILDCCTPNIPTDYTHCLFQDTFVFEGCLRKNIKMAWSGLEFKSIKRTRLAQSQGLFAQLPVDIAANQLLVIWSCHSSKHGLHPMIRAEYSGFCTCPSHFLAGLL